MRAFFCLYLCFYPLLNLTSVPLTTLVQEANANYQRGEQATSYPERKQAFNRALKLYMEIEERVGQSSSQLNQALANTYFQLGEHPWSILYNQRALKLEPRNPIIHAHLALAQEKLGLATLDSPSLMEKLLLAPLLSLPQRLELLFWLLLATALTCSCAIWWRLFAWSLLAALGALASSFLLLNCLIAFYFSPIEAILVASTGLYQAPSFQQPQVTLLPLLAGSKVRVLGTAEDGNWIKILDADGQLGYIPALALRLI